MFPTKRCRYCAGKMEIFDQVCPVCGKRQISKKESQHRPAIHHITIKIPIIHDLHLPGVIRIKIQSLPDVVIKKTTKNIILYFKDGKDFIPNLVSCGRYLLKLGIDVDLNRAQIIHQSITLPKTWVDRSHGVLELETNDIRYIEEKINSYEEFCRILGELMDYLDQSLINPDISHIDERHFNNLYVKLDEMKRIIDSGKEDISP